VSKELVYASADDWAAIYVDGELWAEGHSIPAFTWLELIAEEGPFSMVWDHGEAGWFYDMCDEHGRAAESLPEDFNGSS